MNQRTACRNWRTAKPLPPAPRAQAENPAPALICREAYTTYAAQEVVDRLKDLGLRPDRPSVPQPGKLVFVYRPAKSRKAVCRGQQATGTEQDKLLPQAA